MKSLIFCLISSILFQILLCSFQTSLFSEINRNNIGKNVIVSPLSIYQVLSLTTNGARSSTQKEMISLLQNEDIEELNQINYDILEASKKLETVEIANGVMSKFTPLSDFTEISENYLAPVCELESVDQINQWCSEKTHGKIKKILEKLDPDTLIILLNAVYFKGQWKSKFNKSLTKEKPFYNLGLEENEILIDSMNKLEKYNYYENENLQAIELEYEKDSMSAVIILPSKDKDINDFVEKISTENNLNDITKKLRRKKVNLELPKFELENFINLNDFLINMGMKTAFTDFADFTGLTKEGGIKISQVLHKTYLKVDEEGTEAAAVTATIGNSITSIQEPEIIYQMKVNRPFLFLLRNNNFPEDHDLLFISKIEEIKSKN